MGEMIVLLCLAVFGVFYITGGVHALYDGWRPWKHGINWFEF